MPAALTLFTILFLAVTPRQLKVRGSCRLKLTCAITFLLMSSCELNLPSRPPLLELITTTFWATRAVGERAKRRLKLWLRQWKYLKIRRFNSMLVQFN